MRTLAGPLRRLEVVAFSPDGTELAAVGGYDPTSARPGAVGVDRGVLVWHLGGGPAALRHLFADRSAADVAYTADGRWLLVALSSRRLDSDADLGLFAVDRSTYVEPTEPVSYHQSLATAGDRLLTTGGSADGFSSNASLSYYRLGGRTPFRPTWHIEYPTTRWASALAVFPDGRTVVRESTLTRRGLSPAELVVRSATGQPLGDPVPVGPAGWVFASADGRQVVQNAGTSLLVHPLGDPAAEPRKVVFGKKHCTGLAFTPDGRSVLAAGNDGTTRRLDAATWAETGRWDWKAGKVRSVAVSADGLTAAAGTNTGRVILFDLG
jgi:WD40 repeat protein